MKEAENLNNAETQALTADYMKRWGFDALHFLNRKQLISASGLKRRTTPHCFIYCVVCSAVMTFKQFYETVTKKSGVTTTEKFVRILWDKGYTIEQAIHSLQTMNDE